MRFVSSFLSPPPHPYPYRRSSIKLFVCLIKGSRIGRVSRRKNLRALSPITNYTSWINYLTGRDDPESFFFSSTGAFNITHRRVYLFVYTSNLNTNNVHAVFSNSIKKNQPISSPNGVKPRSVLSIQLSKSSRTNASCVKYSIVFTF